MSTSTPRRIALLFPANPARGLDTPLEETRFSAVAQAFTARGVTVIAAPFANSFAAEIRQRLRDVDAVLVWFNPMEGGQDRSVLNAMLRDVAAHGALVSAHPDVIDRMGTKDVLYRTRDMGWGTDTRLYTRLEGMAAALPQRLAEGPKVLKQMRGQSGDGVWRVELARARDAGNGDHADLRVRHAKRGSVEEIMSIAAFLDTCRPYFATGGMLEQPYQSRLREGMIRCYVVGDRVEGFGEQLINALYPAPEGGAAADAPQPGPRLYFPPTRADFQALKHKLERDWIGQMCEALGLERAQLPVLWDADFLLGPKDAQGADTYVMCEINVSSVYPFPPSALEPLVTEALGRLAARQ
ncbi:MAG: hypothetical protein EKK41_06045 [Hyphomicrobiales bacterium]|nr:MAG: hypothetical protein EKK41_06045 [Hyphomicrobiales bacterium]